MSGLEAFLLLGCIHALVLGVVVLRRRQNRAANRYLAILLGVLSIMLLDGFLIARGTLFAHPHLIGLAAWTPFAIGPLVFIYVRELTAQVGAPVWRHFVIPAGYVVLLLVTF